MHMKEVQRIPSGRLAATRTTIGRGVKRFMAAYIYGCFTWLTLTHEEEETQLVFSYRTNVLDFVNFSSDGLHSIFFAGIRWQYF